MKNCSTDIIVIGGGAAGMMAAITAAKEGAKVIILEHINMLGKKILMTGNGRCNFTNIEQGAHYYRSESPDFVLPALQTFSSKDAITFFHELGIMTTEKNGYCYPRTMQASVIRDALERELNRLNVRFYTDIGIRKVSKQNERFLVESKTGNYSCKKLILATGGKSEPKSGSDGSGYVYAKQLGHAITDTVPALVPLLSSAKWLKDVKGVRQDAKVSIFVDDVFVFADHGEVQFADYGISGIPVFQISRFAAYALQRNQKVKVAIDFVPDMDMDSLTTWIQNNITYKNGKCTIVELLAGIVNFKLADVISEMLPFTMEVLTKLSSKQLNKLIDNTVMLLKDTIITITDTKPFAQSQVTAGGVNVNYVHSESMESKSVPGLFFSGEILDVDGMCGGYNLQWAWSSGYLAGKCAANSLK